MHGYTEHETNSLNRLPLPASNPQLRSTSQILETTQSLLASCPTSRYVLIAQPNLHASDLRDAHTGKCLAPNLCAHSTSSRVRGRFDVAEVVGRDMGVEELRTSIDAACEAQGKAAKVVDFKLDELPASSSGEPRRSAAMAAMDEMLGKILDEEEKEEGGEYTVIYFSSPHEASLRNYESEYVESAVAPMELKRRSAEVIGEGVGRRADSGNSSSAPLFVKYQFFTPGTCSLFVFWPQKSQVEIC